MGSRLFFKSLFWGSSNNSSLKSGSGSYESTTALEPPVKGSYPVAGNGPNVEETLHRARVKREAKQNEGRTNTIVGNMVSKRASFSRKQSDTTTQAHAQRPRTAPHNGEPGGYGYAVADADDGRTRSGFSMKSPPSFFRRRSSSYSTQSPPDMGPPPPIPTKPAMREVHAYTPSKGPTPSTTPAPAVEPHFSDHFTPPFAQQHHRNFSRNSQSSHVDVLDAHSSIVGREPSSVRAKAAGLRSYGEDVADRNIAVFGDQRLDLNSSDFGYLKSVYSGRRRQASDGVVHSTSQTTKTAGDDTGSRTNNGKARSSTSLNTGVISPVYASASIGRNEVHSHAPKDQTNRDLAPVSFASPSKSETPPPKNPRRKDSDPIDFSTLPRGRQVREYNPPTLPPKRLSSLGQVPSRVVSPVEESPRSSSFQYSPRRPHSRQSSFKAMGHHSSRPVSRSNSITYSESPNTSPPGAFPNASQSQEQMSQPRSIGNRQQFSSNGANEASHSSPPAGYSPAFTIKPIPDEYKQPNSLGSQRGTELSQEHTIASTPRSTNSNQYRQKENEPLSSSLRSTSNGNKKYLVEGANEAPNLDGIVDLTNTVDTEVITKTLPAVVHEKIIPTRHEIREEKITREIHTHDVFHRVLPIIEREILPTKHYIYAPDGKSLIEIPESEIPGRTQYNSGGHWQFVPTPPRQVTPVKQDSEQHYRQSSNPYPRTSERQVQSRRASNASQIARKPLPTTPANEIDDAAEPPVIPYNRDESTFPSRSRGHSLKSVLDPILTSKRESVSADGSFRKEYLWRHAPTYENYSRPASSRSAKPTYVGAGIGDISQEGVNAGRDLYFSDATTDSELSPDPRKPHDSDDLLFRDSGYGNSGDLPGIQTGGAFDTNGIVGEFDRMRLGHMHKSKGNGKEVLVEREDESDEHEMVEERFRNANRKMRQVREKRSRSDLRKVSQLAAE